LLVAFIVYPLVVFYSALIVIRLCPSGVQSAARSFVLSSLGIDEEVQGTLRSLVRSVNENNEYIDFTRTLIFQTPSRSEYYEDIRYGQTVKVKSVAYYPGKASRDAICLVTQDLPSTRVGTLFINVAGTDINEPREIPSRPGERQEITPSLGQDFWKRVKQRLGRSTNDITLRFNFVPNSEIIASPFGKCNDINVVLSMTVFKPQLQR
jgi:hypothetical protein